MGAGYGLSPVGSGIVVASSERYLPVVRRVKKTHAGHDRGGGAFTMEPVNGENRGRAKVSVWVPGMRSRRTIGLGSVLKSMTTALGVRPCQGCIDRASGMDRLLEFRGRGPCCRDGKAGDHQP